MDSPDQFSDRGNAAKARRQNLPTLLTETSSPQSDNQNYSRLPLSPVTALIHTRYKAVQFTPITAIPAKSSVGTFKGPMICSPSTPLRTTILERFLADTYEADALNEAAFQQPLTLSTAGITDALPSPDYVVPSWGNVMGSPPETFSDCFSPFLGTDPAEQYFDQEPQSTTSYKSEGEPRSALSIKSIQSSKSLPSRLPNLGLNLNLNLHVGTECAEGAESAEGQIQQHHNGAVQKESNTEAPAAVPLPCSPTSTEITFVEEDLAATHAATTVPAAITVSPTVPVAKTTRFRRNSFPQLLRNRKDRPQLLATLPTPDQNGHPHPLRSAPFEAPVFSNDQEEPMKTMSPPPTPTTNNFEDQLPPVRIRIEPSPFSPPPAPTLGFFPVSLPETVPTIDSSPFVPPPTPTLPRFHEEFPSSPVHAGPAPINTTILFLPWRQTQGPESTLNSPVLPDVRMRSIDPPPGPIQSSFPETFHASPVRTRPAPILTIPPRETIVQMTPPASVADSFDARYPVSPNNNESTHPSVTKTRATKSSKVVRFAVVESPLRNNHFKILPSPYPWPPRTIGDATIASILTPTAVEFNTSRPYPKTEHCKPSMADVLLDGTTPRGRTEQRHEKVGRLTRSMSPKNSRAEEVVEPAILPNTVFERQKDQSHSTRSPIASDKNIILRTYFNPNEAAIQK